MKPEIPKQENAYSQYGKLAHELLEEWAKDELLDADLPIEWENRYRKQVTLPFPKANEEKEKELFEMGKKYFSNFHGFGNNMDIIAVEEKYLTEIEGFRFTGIADLVEKHQVTGELIITDHKTKTAAAMKKDRDKCFKQLYLYSGMVKEKYGEFPKVLAVNAIQANEVSVEIFNAENYQRTIDWATDIAAQILVEEEFPRKENWYFCNFICSAREYCMKQQALENPFGIDI